MAYLHCHDCDWSQDDFWDFSFGKYGYWGISRKLMWRYNPISCFLSYVFTKRGYWFPKRIDHDDFTAKECGWKRRDPHSWWLAWRGLKRTVRKFRTQEWWTHKAFEEEINKVCPKCNSTNLDID